MARSAVASPEVEDRDEESSKGSGDAVDTSTDNDEADAEGEGEEETPEQKSEREASERADRIRTQLEAIRLRGPRQRQSGGGGGEEKKVERKAYPKILDAEMADLDEVAPKASKHIRGLIAQLQEALDDREQDLGLAREFGSAKGMLPGMAALLEERGRKLSRTVHRTFDKLATDEKLVHLIGKDRASRQESDSIKGNCMRIIGEAESLQEAIEDSGEDMSLEDAIVAVVTGGGSKKVEDAKKHTAAAKGSQPIRPGASGAPKKQGGKAAAMSKIRGFIKARK